MVVQTCPCSLLISGMEQIAFATGEKAQVQSVLLLTDGLANEGIKTKDGILAEMTKLQSPPRADVASKVSVCTSYVSYRIFWSVYYRIAGNFHRG